MRDAEHVRRALLGDEPGSILGQSFGGFTALTYLPLAPDGVRESATCSTACSPCAAARSERSLLVHAASMRTPSPTRG